MSFGLMVSRCSRDMICARMRSTAVGIEARLGQREPQVVEGLVAVVLERAQRAAQIVAAGAEAELDRLALEPLLEGLGVEGAGALVEQAGRHVGDAGLARRVLVGAAEEGEIRRRSAAAAESRTSQASMPPGLTTRSIVIACAAGAASHNADAGDQRGQRARAGAAQRSGTRSRAFLLGPACP